MIRFALLFSILFTGALWAQGSVKTTDGSGAILRTLDRISGQVEDFEVKNGGTANRAKLSIAVSECRYPVRAINRDAFARLTIKDKTQTTPVFEGWMIASSPALSAMEHPRYDVWVLRCLNPE